MGKSWVQTHTHTPPTRLVRCGGFKKRRQSHKTERSCLSFPILNPDAPLEREREAHMLSSSGVWMPVPVHPFQTVRQTKTARAIF